MDKCVLRQFTGKSTLLHTENITRCFLSVLRLILSIKRNSIKAFLSMDWFYVVFFQTLQLKSAFDYINGHPFSLQSTWICSLCKKKQELLKKTGQWYHGNPNDLLGGDASSLVSPNASMTGSHSGLINSGGGAGGGRILPQNGLPQNAGLRQQPGLQRQKSHDPSGGHHRDHPYGQPGGLPHSHSQLPPHDHGGSNAAQMQRQQSLRRRDTVDPAGAMGRGGPQGDTTHSNT